MKWIIKNWTAAATLRENKYTFMSSEHHNWILMALNEGWKFLHYQWSCDIHFTFADVFFVLMSPRPMFGALSNGNNIIHWRHIKFLDRKSIRRVKEKTQTPEKYFFGNVWKERQENEQKFKSTLAASGLWNIVKWWGLVQEVQRRFFLFPGILRVAENATCNYF